MATANEEFTAPIYRDEPQAEAHEEESLSDVEAEGVDLNDPSLLQYEVTGVNAAADPYATPPPPPDAWYRVKLKRLDVKKKDGTLGPFSVKPEAIKGQPVLLPSGAQKHNAWMAIEATILDPGGKYDNLHARDYFISTRIDRRTQTSTMIHLLTNVFKWKLPETYNAETLVNQMVKILAGEPECDCELVWKASPNQTDSDAIKAKGLYPPEVKGMHKFPQVNGQYVPEMMVDVANFGKVSIRAQIGVNGYAPAGTKTKKK